MESIRVLIADDKTLVRQSLAQLLNAEPDIEVVGVAADGEQVLHLCRQHLPDVVLMDLQMPKMDGIEATKRIKQEMPSVEVCILTIYDDDLLLFDALRAGAKGYVLKDATPQQVAEAVRIVASGGGILPPPLVPKVLAEFQRFSETKAELRKLFSELTPRERDILRLLAQGKSNREIAQILYLTEKTVRNYVSNIFILWKNFFAQGDATDEYLLEMLFSLQRMLEGQKQRRVFLSVDVVKSSEMKQASSELEVEHSFQQFHSWLEGVVTKHGGQIHSVAGDGAMCMFTEDVEAVKAALELQGSIHQFNATRNLLPTPFQIRCGISAGNVPVEEGMLIGQIHSHVLDRAANLQKKAKPGGIVIGGEVSGAALMLLGTFSPLPDYPNSQVAFEWRPENEFSTEAM